MKPPMEGAAARKLNVHLANERTFLAWIRTSIGIMAFGFVVQKFALFMRQISYFIARTGLPQAGRSAAPRGYSSIFGVAIVALGASLGVFALFRYKGIERQINADLYRPSWLLDAMLAVSVFVIGIMLASYLIRSL